MSWRDWQTMPEAIEMQRSLTAVLIGRDDRPIAWRDIKRCVVDLMDANRNLSKRLNDLETGKHKHEWKHCWDGDVAGGVCVKNTRCIHCGISMAEFGNCATCQGVKPETDEMRLANEPEEKS